MKIFIAGIRPEIRHAQVKTDELQAKRSKALVQAIIELLPKIMQDSQERLGLETLVFVLLPEGALSLNAIHVELKHQLLKSLQAAVMHYPNCILMPGSFLAYKHISEYRNPAEKIRKVERQYLSLLNNAVFRRCDPFFSAEENQFRILSLNYSTAICLQNSAYLLSGTDKIKHKKSATWAERQVIKPASKRKNTFFDIGADNPVKSFIFNNRNLTIGLVICYEHHDNFHTNTFLRNARPHFQAILSDTTELCLSNLHGAVNMHMDSVLGLSVFMNHSHPKVHEITAMLALQYDIDSNQEVFVEINDFEKYTGKEAAASKKRDCASCSIV